MSAKTETPKAPKKAPAKPAKADPRVRRAPINRIQANALAQLKQEMEAAAQLDNGVIKARIAWNNYCTAIVHGDGEHRAVQVLAVEPGTGRKHFLVYKKP